MDLEKLQAAGRLLVDQFSMGAFNPLEIIQAGKVISDICHASSVEGGWWNDLNTGESLRGKRNVGELLCLIHSEISEGYEAWITDPDMRDDHLKHRPMLEVELADAIVRIGDLYGSLDFDLGKAMTLQCSTYKSIVGLSVDVVIARIHLNISKALEGYRKNRKDPDFPEMTVLETRLAEAVIHIVELSKTLNYDLGAALMEKVTYNRNRADHKPENRRKAEGKKF